MTQQLGFETTPEEILRLRDGHNKTWLMEDACREMDDGDPKQAEYYKKIDGSFVPLLNQLCEEIMGKGWTSCIWPKGTVLKPPCHVCPALPWRKETCPAWDAPLLKEEEENA